MWSYYGTRWTSFYAILAYISIQELLQERLEEKMKNQ